MARLPQNVCQQYALLALVTAEEVAWLRAKGAKASPENPPAGAAAVLGELIAKARTGAP
jgi:uncharacterized membrane protein (DUF441 family)